jgi:hypothetical protein
MKDHLRTYARRLLHAFAEAGSLQSAHHLQPLMGPNGAPDVDRGRPRFVGSSRIPTIAWLPPRVWRYRPRAAQGSISAGPSRWATASRRRQSDVPEGTRPAQRSADHGESREDSSLDRADDGSGAGTPRRARGPRQPHRIGSDQRLIASLSSRSTDSWDSQPSHRTRFGPQQERHAKRSNPESPAAASDEACEIEHRKAGEGRCQDVSLIEQIEHADDQADDS